MSLKLEEIIVKAIVETVDGMFLLAQLQAESRTDKTSPKAVRKAIEKLPTGSDALHITYSQAKQRVEAQKLGFKNLTEQALNWVLDACRLLMVTE